MNTIVTAFLLLISGVSSRYLKCPESSGKFPIENSLCKSYYQCENWKVTSERTCPAGQNFNPVHQRCDYEELYYCAEGALEKYKRCKKATGKFYKENSACKGYYQCENWQVTGEFTCPPGQNFNQELQWCDWEEIYPCLEDIQSTKCPKPTGFFPKPGSQCKSFYQCINGKPRELQCPHDLIFDPLQGKCEWPELYSCDETEETTTPLDVKTSATPTEAKETTEGYTTASSEETKADIVTVETTRKTEMVTTASPTEESTSASTEEIYTETESTAGPTAEQTSQSTKIEGTDVTTEKYTLLPTEETSPDAGTVSASELDTKHSTELTPSIGGTEETVSSTVSDQKSTTARPGTVTINTHGTAIVPTDIPGDIVCPESTGLFPHPTDKHKFLACLEFVPTVMDCPNDLIYEPALVACVWDRRNRL